MRRALLLILVVLVAAACGGQVAEPTTSLPPATTTAAVTTTEAPTTTATTTTAAAVTTTLAGGDDEHLTEVDLSAFAEAWSSGDPDAIRAFYTEDAIYVSADEVAPLWQGEVPGVAVESDTLAQRVSEWQGWRFRIVGTPIGIYDKLVAFMFRWEGAEQGYGGAALLRYEGGRVWLHTYALAAEATPNQAGGSYLEPVDVSALLQVWRDSDPGAAAAVYTGEPVILSDEDLVRAPWRDYHSPPGVGVVGSKIGWDPVAIGTPARMGDLAVFAWHWEAFDYPVGYGVRLVRFDGDRVAVDIRFAVRPWEPSGSSFLAGG